MIRKKYSKYITKFNEILTIRDLTKNTVINYTSFLIQYLTWVDSELSKPLEDVSYEELRIYILHLKNIRKLSASTINAHISQLRFFYIYINKLPTIYSKEIIFQFIDSGESDVDKNR